MARHPVTEILFLLLVLALLVASCAGPPTPALPSASPTASPTWPPASIPTAPVEAVYLASIGGGPGKGQFNNPRGIAVDKTGKVYVADTAYDRVQVFDTNGAFLYMWGSEGTAPGQFSVPRGIAVDGVGNIYVTDSLNNRVQVFTDNGTFVRAWGSLGSGQGEFNRPSGIAVDGAGNTYVVDSWNARVQVFNTDGTFLRSWGSKGSGDGQFISLIMGRPGGGPDGIALDSQGNVYVADTWNNRVQVFTSEGRFLRKWGAYGTPTKGKFNTPSGIAVDTIGNVFVASEGMQASPDRVSVQKFTAKGEFLARWGSPGFGEGQFDHPAGVAVDQAGNIYVADARNNPVQKFSNEGSFLTQWGSVGEGLLKGPTGVAVDGEGNIYVADSQHRRVVKFSPDGAVLAQWGSEGRGRGQFYHMNGIVIDSKGFVYVAGDDRVQVFTGDGKFLRAWGGDGGTWGARGKFSGPMKIALDGAGNVYVADGRTVQKFSPDGKLLEFWKPPDSPRPEELGIDLSKLYDRERLLPVLAGAKPESLAIDIGGNIYIAERGGYQNELDIAKYGNNRFGQVRVLSPSGQELARWLYGEKRHVQGRIAVDSAGRIFLADSFNNNVQVFNTRGELLGAWGSRGFGNYQFDGPTAIAVSPWGKVYVADYVNNRVQVFQIKERQPATAPSSPESSPTPSEYVRYEAGGVEGSSYGWSIAYPEGWAVSKLGPDAWQFVLPGVARVVVSRLPFGFEFTSLDSWVDADVSDKQHRYRAVGKTMTVVSRKVILLSDNITGVDVITEITPDGKSRDIYVLVDGHPFVVTAQAAIASWDRLDPVFDHMTSSFTVSKY